MVAAALAGGFAWLFSPVLLPLVRSPQAPSSNPVFLRLAWTLVELLLLFVTAIAIHEIGHCVAARALGVACHHAGRPKAAAKGGGTLYWLVEIDADLTRRQEWLITLAGPAFNIACYVLCFVVLTLVPRGAADQHVAMLAACNASVAVTNLMPFRLQDTVSDGERMLALRFEKRT